MKARAVPRHLTAARKQHCSAMHGHDVHRTQPSATKSAAVDHQEPALQRRIERSLGSAPTAMLDNERDDALFALAVLARCRRQACWSVEVRARMECSLTTRHGRVPLSQAAEVQWCSHRRESVRLQAAGLLHGR